MLTKLKSAAAGNPPAWKSVILGKADELCLATAGPRHGIAAGSGGTLLIIDPDTAARKLQAENPC